MSVGDSGERFVHVCVRASRCPMCDMCLAEHRYVKVVNVCMYDMAASDNTPS